MEKNLLEHLSIRHNDWLNMVRSFGKQVSDDLANEITQEMYVRMIKYVGTPDKIMYGDSDDINTMYVYVTLRNLYSTHMKQENLSFEYIDDINENVDDLDIEFENDLIDLQNKMLSYINTWHYYDAKLCKLIIIDNIPMRKLSRDTDISLYSISNSVTKFKKKLKEKFGGNYDKILKLKN